MHYNNTQVRQEDAGTRDRPATVLNVYAFEEYDTFILLLFCCNGKRKSSNNRD